MDPDGRLTDRGTGTSPMTGRSDGSAEFPIRRRVSMHGAPAPSLLRAASNWKADRLTDEPNPDGPASRQSVIDSLIAEGVPPHIVYAFRTTGMLVTTQMYGQLSEEDRERWDDALRTFETLEWEAERSPPH